MKYRLFDKGKALIIGYLLMFLGGAMPIFFPAFFSHSDMGRMAAHISFFIGVALLLAGCIPPLGFNRCQMLWVLKITNATYPYGKILAVFNSEPSVNDILFLRNAAVSNCRQNREFFPDSPKDYAYLVRDYKLHGFSDEVWELTKISTARCLIGQSNI